jgi:hypothetical protein
MSKHCCHRMEYDLNQKCDVHQDRSDCPDTLIACFERGYGLFVHDGGSAVIEIKYCPWCGSKLPESGQVDSTACSDCVEHVSAVIWLERRSPP